MPENLSEMDDAQHRDIDPERYDEENPNTCQVCGSETRGVGDRSATGAYCPECEKYVWIA